MWLSAKAVVRARSPRYRRRLDQRRVLVVDVAYAPIYWPDNHVFGRIRREQRLQCCWISRALAEPSRPIFDGKDDRHAVVQFGKQLVRRGCDDREAAHSLPGGRAPRFPKAG